jgi:hypothetical protein
MKNTKQLNPRRQSSLFRGALKNMFKQYNLKCPTGRVSRALGADVAHGHADQQTR